MIDNDRFMEAWFKMMDYMLKSKENAIHITVDETAN